jgi:hypothetical protein
MRPIRGKTWPELHDEFCAKGNEMAARWLEDGAGDHISIINDNVARALDFHGWMIVPKPGGPADDGRKWPVSNGTGYVPDWAEK